MKTVQHYTTPEVEIIEMNVEQGFTVSGETTDGGDGGDIIPDRK